MCFSLYHFRGVFKTLSCLSATSVVWSLELCSWILAVDLHNVFLDSCFDLCLGLRLWVLEAFRRSCSAPCQFLCVTVAHLSCSFFCNLSISLKLAVELQWQWCMARVIYRTVWHRCIVTRVLVDLPPYSNTLNLKWNNACEGKMNLNTFGIYFHTGNFSEIGFSDVSWPTALVHH